MLQAGKNVTQLNDPLVKIQVEYLYQAVKSPKPELETEIRQLRMVKAIDNKRYTQLKKNLPYVVCGIFSPPVRRGENFAWISHFMLDFDHLAEKGVSVETLKNTLSSDPFVKLMFVSPGDDGLKVLFQLSEKCYDRGKYSLFYKLFSKKFAAQYQLDQVIDASTSDVTRACFMSVDPDAFFNKDALSVDMKNYLDFDNMEQIKEISSMLKQEEKQQAKEAETKDEKKENERQQIDKSALDKIKLQLNPNFRLKAEKQIFVPAEIEKVIELIVNKMKEFEIETTETINIHYGKKFRFRFGLKESEINLFYGKKGFTVVISPRNGTDPELNMIAGKLIEQILGEQILPQAIHDFLTPSI